MNTPVTVLGKLSDSVLFSGMSGVQDEQERLRSIFYGGTYVVTPSSCPAWCCSNSSWRTWSTPWSLQASRRRAHRPHPRAGHPVPQLDQGLRCGGSRRRCHPSLPRSSRLVFCAMVGAAAWSAPIRPGVAVHGHGGRHCGPSRGHAPADPPRIRFKWTCSSSSRLPGLRAGMLRRWHWRHARLVLPDTLHGPCTSWSVWEPMVIGLRPGPGVRPRHPPPPISAMICSPSWPQIRLPLPPSATAGHQRSGGNCRRNFAAAWPPAPPPSSSASRLACSRLTAWRLGCQDTLWVKGALTPADSIDAVTWLQWKAPHGGHGVDRISRVRRPLLAWADRPWDAGPTRRPGQLDGDSAVFSISLDSSGLILLSPQTPSFSLVGAPANPDASLPPRTADLGSP